MRHKGDDEPYDFKDGDDHGGSEVAGGIKMLVTSQTALLPHQFTSRYACITC